MPGNVFDKAARYAARLDPPGFLGWALGVPADAVGFQGWLDTRGVAFPGDPDRTGDTVARLDDPAAHQTPWSVAAEFQTVPDPLRFGRLMVYLGQLWLAVKPDPERGSRFHPGAVVLNLTGAGLASRRMEWPAAGLATHLWVVERNLARENADELVAAVETGVLARALLPWVPLMAGGGDAGVIERWKKAAEGETQSRRRSEFGGLAVALSSAAKRYAVWKNALEGWNMYESEAVNEWLDEGRVDGHATSLLDVLETRFGTPPPDLIRVIREVPLAFTLRRWLTQAVTAPTLDDFRRAAGV